MLYATPLSGDRDGRIAVVVHPASAIDVAPLVARAYGLSPSERRITRMCLEGRPTKAIADALEISEYTVQDRRRMGR